MKVLLVLHVRDGHERGLSPLQRSLVASRGKLRRHEERASNAEYHVAGMDSCATERLPPPSRVPIRALAYPDTLKLDSSHDFLPLYPGSPFHSVKVVQEIPNL